MTWHVVFSVLLMVSIGITLIALNGIIRGHAADLLAQINLPPPTGFAPVAFTGAILTVLVMTLTFILYDWINIAVSLRNFQRIQATFTKDLTSFDAPNVDLMARRNLQNSWLDRRGKGHIYSVLEVVRDNPGTDPRSIFGFLKARELTITRFVGYATNLLILLGLLGNFWGLGEVLKDLPSHVIPSASPELPASPPSPSPTPAAVTQRDSNGTEDIVAATPSPTPMSTAPDPGATLLQSFIKSFSGMSTVVISSVSGITGMLIVMFCGTVLREGRDAVFASEQVFTIQKLLPRLLRDERREEVDKLIPRVLRAVSDIPDTLNAMGEALRATAEDAAQQRNELDIFVSRLEGILKSSLAQSEMREGELAAQAGRLENTLTTTAQRADRMIEASLSNIETLRALQSHVTNMSEAARTAQAETTGLAQRQFDAHQAFTAGTLKALADLEGAVGRTGAEIQKASADAFEKIRIDLQEDHAKSLDAFREATAQQIARQKTLAKEIRDLCAELLADSRSLISSTRALFDAAAEQASSLHQTMERARDLSLSGPRLLQEKLDETYAMVMSQLSALAERTTRMVDDCTIAQLELIGDALKEIAVPAQQITDLTVRMQAIHDSSGQRWEVRLGELDGQIADLNRLQERQLADLSQQQTTAWLNLERSTSERQAHHESHLANLMHDWFEQLKSPLAGMSENLARALHRTDTLHDRNVAALADLKDFLQSMSTVSERMEQIQIAHRGELAKASREHSNEVAAASRALAELGAAQRDEIAELIKRTQLWEQQGMRDAEMSRATLTAALNECIASISGMKSAFGEASEPARSLLELLKTDIDRLQSVVFLLNTLLGDDSRIHAALQRARDDSQQVIATLDELPRVVSTAVQGVSGAAAVIVSSLTDELQKVQSSLAVLRSFSPAGPDGHIQSEPTSTHTPNSLVSPDPPAPHPLN